LTTLQHVFSQTSIVLFNSIVIIDLLRAKFVVKQIIKELTITLLLQNSNKCFIRTSQESKSIKKVINYIRNFYDEENISNIYSNLLFRLLRRVEKQTNILKLIEKNLNKYLIATIARKERRQQCNTIVVNNIIKLITTRDCKTIISMRAQQITKLVVVKAKQEIQQITKKIVANVLKIAKKKITKTIRIAKRFKKKSQNKTKKKIFVAKKAIVATKKQEHKTKKIANVTKQVAKTTITKIIVAKIKITKNVETNKKTTHN